jgi:hypothetical protein
LPANGIKESRSEATRTATIEHSALRSSVPLDSLNPIAGQISRFRSLNNYFKIRQRRLFLLS